MSDPMNSPSVSNPLASGPVVESDPAQRTQAMIAHLAGIFGIVGTGIFYLIKKNDPTAGPFVKDQIKEAFNFHVGFIAAYIAMIVVAIVLGLISSTLMMIWSLVMMLVCVGVLVLVILSALKANKGIAARYPFKIPVLK